MNKVRLLLSLSLAACAISAGAAQEHAAPSSAPANTGSSASGGPPAAAPIGSNAAAAKAAAENAPRTGDAQKSGPHGAPHGNAPGSGPHGAPQGNAPGNDSRAKRVDRPGSGAASKGGSEHGVAKAPGAGDAAIDTRITVFAHPSLRRPKANTAATPLTPRTLPHSLTPHENASPVRNATGVLMPNPGSANARGGAPSAAFAYGTVTGGGGRGPLTGGSGSARPSAPVNAHISNPYVSTPHVFNPPAFNPHVFNPHVSPAQNNNSVITGTGTTRRGSGAATIGGPSKTLAGTINGTGMRGKRP